MTLHIARVPIWTVTLQNGDESSSGIATSSAEAEQIALDFLAGCWEKSGLADEMPDDWELALITLQDEGGSELVKIDEHLASIDLDGTYVKINEPGTGDPDGMNKRRIMWGQELLGRFEDNVQELTKTDDEDALADGLAYLFHALQAAGRDPAKIIQNAAELWAGDTRSDPPPALPSWITDAIAAQ